MWKRSLKIPPSWWLSSLIRAGSRYPALALRVVRPNLYAGQNHLDSTPRQLLIRESEHVRFCEELKELGIDAKSEYAVLVVRDSVYFSHLTVPLSNGSVRDRAISDFVPTVTALVNLGVQVVRLGHRVREPLGIDLPGVLDYATCGFRSEFLDIMLPLHASFGISTLTGPDALCQVGRKPVLYIDVPIYANLFHGTSNTWWTPARLKAASEPDPVTVETAFYRGWGWYEGADEFEASDVVVLRSSPAEIAEDTLSFHCELREFAQDDGENLRIRQQLAESLGKQGHLMHGEIRSRVPRTFLMRHPWMFQ